MSETRHITQAAQVSIRSFCRQDAAQCSDLLAIFNKSSGDITNCPMTYLIRS